MNGHTKRVAMLVLAIVGLVTALLALVLRDVDPLSSRQFLNASITALGSLGVIASRPAGNA